VRGINKVVLMGHIGKDPDIRSTTDGKIVVNLAIATTDRQKDQAGKWQDKTEWHNLVAFGRTAEIVRDYVRKGSHVHIEGKIQTRSWDDAEGQKKYRTEVLVDDLILLGTPGSKENRQSEEA
jgi:single-strand DNA-binding protein